MRLLLIGPEARDRSVLRNYSGVWSHYLTREFEKAGVSVMFVRQLAKPFNAMQALEYHRQIALGGVDHVLALGTRYFEKVPAECAAELRSRCRGAVTQMHDGFSRAGVDCTFTVKEVGERRHHYVGWAADPEICVSAQDPSDLRILIDHPNYGRGGDHTRSVILNVKCFVRSLGWSPKFRTASARRIADGGVVDGFAPLEKYTRQSVPFEVICQEYAKAHVFMVTHKESLGLSVLETAMAGALPLVPRGFVPRDRLATVRHIEYRTLNWGEVLARINPTASREIAIGNFNTWDKVAARILGWLSAFRRAT